jgi:hypothetical protein
MRNVIYFYSSDPDILSLTIELSGIASILGLLFYWVKKIVKRKWIDIYNWINKHWLIIKAVSGVLIILAVRLHNFESTDQIPPFGNNYIFRGTTDAKEWSSVHFFRSDSLDERGIVSIKK